MQPAHVSLWLRPETPLKGTRNTSRLIHRAAEKEGVLGNLASGIEGVLGNTEG
jgi:hypothetical protein